MPNDNTQPGRPPASLHRAKMTNGQFGRCDSEVVTAWRLTLKEEPPAWLRERMKRGIAEPGAVNIQPVSLVGTIAIMNMNTSHYVGFAIVRAGDYFIQWGETEVGFVSAEDFAGDYSFVGD